MGMGSKPGYGPREPRGTVFAGKRARKPARKAKRVTEKSLAAARLHSSQADRPKVTDTMTNRRRGGGGMYVRPSAGELAQRPVGVTAPAVTRTSPGIPVPAGSKGKRASWSDEIKAGIENDRVRTAMMAIHGHDLSAGESHPLTVHAGPEKDDAYADAAVRYANRILSEDSAYDAWRTVMFRSGPTS